MSIYSYLFCDDCKKKMWVADPDIKHLHVERTDLFKFLEEHRNHKLSYDWEDGERDVKCNYEAV